EPQRAGWRRGAPEAIAKSRWHRPRLFCSAGSRVQWLLLDLPVDLLIWVGAQSGWGRGSCARFGCPALSRSGPPRNAITSMTPRTASIVVNRTAPTRQVIRALCPGELHRLLQGFIEVIVYHLSSHSAAQEVGPKKLAERRGILGKSTEPPQLSCKAAKGIIDEVGNGLWQLLS